MRLLFSLAWRNLWRHRRRSFLNMALLAIAVMIIVFLISIHDGMYERMISNAVDLSVGDILIQEPLFEEDPVIENFIFKTADDEKILKKENLIKAYAPRIETYGLISGPKTTQGAALVGIDPVLEKTVSVLANKVTTGSFLTTDDLDGVLIGQTLAENLDLKVGSELVVLTQDYYHQTSAAKYIVRGFLLSGAQEVDGFQVFFNLKGLQNLLSVEDGVSKFVIRLKNHSQLPKAVINLNQSMKPLNVLTWKIKLKSILEMIELEKSGIRLITSMFGIVIFFGLLNTSLMNVLERTREIGVLKAIGTDPQKVAMQYFLETLMLSLTGLAVGMVLGTLLMFYFAAFPITLHGFEEEFKRYNLEAQMFTVFKFKTLFTAFSSILVYCLVSSVYPAWRASRISILKALQGA
jgi:ABC-type lipoprotein release transport system permease subunit